MAEEDVFRAIISAFVLFIFLGVLVSYYLGRDTGWVVDVANSLAGPVVVIALILAIVLGIRGSM